MRLIAIISFTLFLGLGCPILAQAELIGEIQIKDSSKELKWTLDQREMVKKIIFYFDLKFKIIKAAETRSILRYKPASIYLSISGNSEKNDIQMSITTVVAELDRKPWSFIMMKEWLKCPPMNKEVERVIIDSFNKMFRAISASTAIR